MIAMLVGYNNNITYKGKVYHVQTEDSGLNNPIIVTLLYFKGTILASKKISYSHLIGIKDIKKSVRELMQEQHKAMLKELNTLLTEKKRREKKKWLSQGSSEQALPSLK
ncbi:MAG: hypothetical protein QMD07_05110 [Thermodesulfovibrionales bacterium]|nr:hypothetical protein [Thermodesulfovibrionales bacterium]